MLILRYLQSKTKGKDDHEGPEFRIAKGLINEQITRHVLTGQIIPATTTPGSWTTIVWSIIPIYERDPWKVMVWKKNLPCVNCDLHLGNMSLSQGHDTIAWCIIKILLGSDNLWPGYGFGYVCTVTITSEIWPWVKVMTHPWVMDNNCVKYYPDPTWQWGVMAQTRILGMCAVWPWPRRYDLGSRLWHIIRS